MRSESLLAQVIDHTFLKPQATSDDIHRVCEEAKLWGFYSVCLDGVHVDLARKLLEDSNTRVCAVVGFPTGAHLSSVKAFETERIKELGAEEFDMVLNIGALRNSDDESVLTDIEAVVSAADPFPVKVILETCLLTDAEKRKACEISIRAGAAFVKTSTGFSQGGATLDDVSLMKSTVGDSAQVKASGGIRSLKDANDFLDAGASRLGTSSGVQILNEARGTTNES